MHSQDAFAECTGVFEAADPARLFAAASCYLLRVHCREVPLPSGSAAAHRTRRGSDGSAPVAQSTEQPLRLTPCTGVRPGSLPPCRQAHPSDGCVSPLESPYLTARPSARSRLEGEIPLRSQTPAGTDAPAGCRALGIHPHVSPKSSGRASPVQASAWQEGPALLLAGRCPREGICPPREAPLGWAEQGAGCGRLPPALLPGAPLPSPITSACRPAGVSLWVRAPTGKHINWETNLIKH